MRRDDRWHPHLRGGRRAPVRLACAAALALAPGCGLLAGEEESAIETESPAPVAPLEVAATDEPAAGAEAASEAAAGDVAGSAGSEVEQLRARVAELEAELASCRGEPSGTQTAAIPEGVDVPDEGVADAEEADGTQSADGEDEDDSDERRASRRRRRDPDLIDTILGDDDRPRRRRRDGEETLEVPNPVDVLLGP